MTLIDAADTSLGIRSPCLQVRKTARRCEPMSPRLRLCKRSALPHVLYCESQPRAAPSWAIATMGRFTLPCESAYAWPSPAQVYGLSQFSWPSLTGRLHSSVRP